MIAGVRARLRARWHAWAIYEHCRLAYHADAWYACIAIQTTIGRGRTTTWGPITSVDRRADLAAFMDGDQAAAWRPAGWTGHEQSDFTCTETTDDYTNIKSIPICMDVLQYNRDSDKLIDLMTPLLRVFSATIFE